MSQDKGRGKHTFTGDREMSQDNGRGKHTFTGDREMLQDKGKRKGDHRVGFELWN